MRQMWRPHPVISALRNSRVERRGNLSFVNGKWLSQPPSGTQRYATEVMKAISNSPQLRDLALVLPRDAAVPEWGKNFRVFRSRTRGIVFEQVALPWLTRGGWLYSLAGPAPLAKHRQTMVMHDAMVFRYPRTFRLSFVLWYRFMYRLLARTAGRLLTVSQFSRAELAYFLRTDEDRFEVAPPGSDHVARGGLGAHDGLPFAPGTYALLVGNLAVHKKIHETAGALASAGVPVAVAGGLDRKVFRAPAAVDRVSPRYLGRVSDDQLRHLYAGAAVLVAPSEYEGFCMPIIEAGRLGCPCVYAEGSAMAEVAGPGGLGFAPGDVQGCVRSVRGILADSMLRERLAELARANAHRYSWRRTAQVIFDAETTHTVRRPAVRTDNPGSTPPTGPLRVLHVTETFAAGTGIAIVGFAQDSRCHGIEHILIAQDRCSGLLDHVDETVFASASVIPSGFARLWREIGRGVRQYRPDVVHLHSSLAGVAGRARIYPGHYPPVLYSPHCFAFQRRDISGPVRCVYRLAEKLLARRTSAFVCVSPYESDLAARLCPGVPVFSLVNWFQSVERLMRRPPQPVAGSALRLVTTGRITRQKAPLLFAEIVRGLRAAGTEVDATWIGSGDDATAYAELGAAAVRITGWLSPLDVPGVLAAQCVYLHTAAWEAAVPIAVLEAMATGLVVVVRRNPAHAQMIPEEWMFDDAAGAVALLTACSDGDFRQARVAEQFAVLTELAARRPNAVLPTAYRRVAGRDQEPDVSL